MKHFLILLLLCGSAHAQTQTITITRGEWSRTIPQADFAALEFAIEVEGRPGDRVHIVGEFVGGPLDILDLNKIAGGELTGDGPTKSRLIFHAQHDRIGPQEKPEKLGGPALLFADNGSIRIANMYLENTPDPKEHEDGALGGWTSLTGDAVFIPGQAIAVLEDLEVKAHDWGLVYDWMLRSDRTVTLRRVNGVAARGFVCLMHSASKYALTMEDCNIGIDGNLSVSYGATSDAEPITGGVLTPIMLRAGTTKITGCTFWVRGMIPPAGFPAKWVPTRIASVATDQFYSQGARTTQFTARSCKVELVEPNGAKIVSDLDFRWGKQPVWDNNAKVKVAEQTGAAMIADARGGSGPNGEIRIWKPEVK